MRWRLIFLLLLCAIAVFYASAEGIDVGEDLYPVATSFGSYVVVKCLTSDYRFYFFDALPPSCCIVKYTRTLVTEPRCINASTYIHIPLKTTDAGPMFIVGRSSRNKSCVGFRVRNKQNSAVPFTNHTEQKNIDQRSANMLAAPTNQPKAHHESKEALDISPHVFNTELEKYISLSATASSHVPELRREPKQANRPFQEKAVALAVLYDKRGGQNNHPEDNDLDSTHTLETEQRWSDDKGIEEQTNRNNRGEEYINVALPIIVLALIVAIYFVFFNVYFWSHAPF